jgi:hypothetical protein
MDELHELLKNHTSTLEAVGFRWPAEGGGGRGMPGGGGRGMPGAPPGQANPFKADENAKRHLQSLEERLDKKG